MSGEQVCELLARVGIRMCAHSPTTSAVRFQRTQGLLVGSTPGVGDPSHTVLANQSQLCWQCSIGHTIKLKTTYKIEYYGILQRHEGMAQKKLKSIYQLKRRRLRIMDRSCRKFVSPQWLDFFPMIQAFPPMIPMDCQKKIPSLSFMSHFIQPHSGITI